MVRLPTQAELQENFSSSIVEGLGKRHPTTHIAQLTATPKASYAVHWINRDEAEKYAVTIDSDGGVAVLDLVNRVPRTVTTPDGTAYFTTSNPREDLAFLTLSDYTLVVNKKVTVATSGTPPTAAINYRTLNFGALSHGDYSFVYSLTCAAFPSQSSTTIPGYWKERPNGEADWVDEQIITYPANTVQLNYSNSANPSITALVTAFSGRIAQALGSSYVVRVEGGTSIGVYGTSAGQTIPTFSWTITRTNDNNSGFGAWLTAQAGVTTAPGALAGTKQLFSALPATATVGDVWKIQGDPSNEFTAYYVKWNGGAWEETTGPGWNLGLDPASMPHVLIRQADGTFVLKRATWDKRLVGNGDTNVDPSFVGSQLRDVTFYRNRLGFVYEGGLCFSRNADFFNFYRATVSTLLDTDPIDIQGNSPRAAKLNYAVPFAKQLVVFSDQAQLTLSATDTFTPKTGDFKQSTEYECSPKVKPVLAGPMLYFCADRGTSTAVQEYYVQQYTQSNRADDITAHCPSYIPSGAFQLTSSPTEDILVVLSTKKRNALYVYQFYWKGEEKAQAAWNRWTLTEGTVIEGCYMMASRLLLALSRPDGLHIEYIDLHPAKVEADLPFLVHLDRKVFLKGTYNAGTGNTSWTLPYTVPEGAVPQVVMGGAFGSRSGGPVLTTRTVSAGNTVTVRGDYTAGGCYLGLDYEARYRFTAQFIRDANGAAIPSADLRLRTFSVYYAKTGYFRAEVTPLARDTVKTPFSGRTLGTEGTRLGSAPISSGVFTFMAQSNAQTIKVDLVNDSYLPCFFQNAEWEGIASMRSQRR